MLRIQDQNKNSTALIINKAGKHQILVKQIAKKLAMGGVEVEVEKKTGDRPADYILYFGLPKKNHIYKLAKLADKILFLVSPSNLSAEEKGGTKKLPVFFLPTVTAEETEISNLTEEILQALFALEKRSMRLIYKKPVKSKDTKTRKHENTKTLPLKKKKPSEAKSLKFPKRPAKTDWKISVHLPAKLALAKFLRPALIFIVILIILSASAVYPILLVKNTKQNLLDSVSALQRGDFEKAKISAQEADNSIRRIKQLYKPVRPVLELLEPEEAKAAEMSIQAAAKSADVIRSAAQLGSHGKEFLSDILSHEPIAVEPTAALFSDRTDILIKHLSVLKESSEKLSLYDSYTSKKVQPLLAAYLPQLAQAEDLFGTVKKIYPLMPEILGANGRKKYLLVLQNNMELRPTGGFIGSVGFLRFENGKFLEVNIEDVYSLDGQLEGQVTPPAPIRDYLGEESWFLRDANWDPDFSRSAQQIKWFLNKEIQTSVDGVIGIDLTFAKNVLTALDGVYLPDFDRYITADNLYLETQNFAEKDFFPGSTNKKDILGSLARNLLIKLSEEKSIPAGKLTSALYKSLSEKHILFYFDDKKTQQAVENLGWSGTLLQPECAALNTATCEPDYLMVVNSNLGVNKVNYFVETKTNFSVNLSRRRLERNLTISYKNNSSSSEFPGGTYKNYLRVLVPENVSLEFVRIGRENANPSSINTEKTGNYLVFGVFVEIPPGQEKSVSLSYTSSYNPSIVDNYQLLVQKQPGTDKPPFAFRFIPQTGTNAEPLNFEVAEGNSLIYNTTLSRDRIFKIAIK